MHEVPPEEINRRLQKLVPGETARGHLFWHPLLARQFNESGIVSYLIYRDPRDVALSEARYLASMNRYHRMHRVYKDLSPDEALMLSIKGWPEATQRNIYYPDINARYRRFLGWLTHETTLAVRFEDLRGPESDIWTGRIVSHYVSSSGHNSSDADEMVLRATRSIDPRRSHTYRQGQVGGWRQAFSREHMQEFHAVAGELLIELGYESTDDWL